MNQGANLKSDNSLSNGHITLKTVYNFLLI